MEWKAGLLQNLLLLVLDRVETRKQIGICQSVAFRPKQKGDQDGLCSYLILLEEQGRVLLGDPILNKLPVFSWVSFRL